MQTTKGFHLIEVLSTLAIISILVSLSVPLYTQYILQVSRLDAASTLQKLSLAMEQFHITHHSYKNASLAALKFPENIAKNHYQLAIKNANDFDYLLVAKPIGKQNKDKTCGSLLLSANEKKDITGSGDVKECW